MIRIETLEKCCGCGACCNICPKHCIVMKSDAEGFHYPVVDTAVCIECHLCEKVCPEIHSGQVARPSATYAAVNPDESVRLASSSGGIFSMLASDVIRAGGIVFGARFAQDWSVEHAAAETLEEVESFRGSKYVQSAIGNTFAQAKRVLDLGRKVLFSGTPCQIAGLKNYLRKDYSNLLAVDFVCHGVPSPMVWHKYLKEEVARQGDRKNPVLPFLPIPCVSEGDSLGSRHGGIEAISFRDKSISWQKYSFALSFTKASAAGEKNTVLPFLQAFNENPYLRIFLSDLSLRPSCYACPAKDGASGADITIGDFWGIERIDPEINDDRGLSLVLVRTEKGAEVMAATGAVLKAESYEDALRYNPSIECSVHRPAYRDFFMKQCGAKGFFFAYDATTSAAVRKRLHRRLWLMFHKQ